LANVRFAPEAAVHVRFAPAQHFWLEPSPVLGGLRAAWINEAGTPFGYRLFQQYPPNAVIAENGYRPHECSVTAMTLPTGL
jgi:hypothetical protein